MSGQQGGSVILVPEHLAGELCHLMSDFIAGQDDTVSGKNIATKICQTLGNAPGGGDVAVLSSLFALWNALPTSNRQATRNKLIQSAVQALTTAYNLCLRVIPGQTSPQDTPEALLRAIVVGLQKLWVDSCGCPECLQCVKGLKALKTGLYEIPNIIPHTKKCNPINVLNTLVHKVVALCGQVQQTYEAHVLTPDFDEIPNLDDSDAVFARTLLATLFHLAWFFMLKDYITRDSKHLKQALGGHCLSVTGNPLPAEPETLRDYIDEHRRLDNHFYFPTAGPLNPFHFPESLLRRVVATDPSLCAADHVQAFITRGGGGTGVPRPRCLAMPPAPSQESERPCSQLTSRRKESLRRNLGPPEGTSPSLPPQSAPASPGSSKRHHADEFSQAACSSLSVVPVASPPDDLEEAKEEPPDSQSPPPGDDGVEAFEAWLEAQDANLEDVRREFSGVRVTDEDAEEGSHEGEFSDLDLSDSDHEGDEDGGAAGGGRSLHSLYSLSAV